MIFKSLNAHIARFSYKKINNMKIFIKKYLIHLW